MEKILGKEDWYQYPQQKKVACSVKSGILNTISLKIHLVPQQSLNHVNLDHTPHPMINTA
jgi:hypothetical protein